MVLKRKRNEQEILCTIQILFFKMSHYFRGNINQEDLQYILLYQANKFVKAS